MYLNLNAQKTLDTRNQDLDDVYHTCFWCLFVCSFPFNAITFIRADKEKLHMSLKEDLVVHLPVRFPLRRQQRRQLATSSLGYKRILKTFQVILNNKI